jgi:hypothetical protein
MTRLAATVIAGDTTDVRDENLSHQVLMTKTAEGVAQRGFMTFICRQKKYFSAEQLRSISLNGHRTIRSSGWFDALHVKKTHFAGKCALF